MAWDTLCLSVKMIQLFQTMLSAEGLQALRSEVGVASMVRATHQGLAIDGEVLVVQA